MSDDTNPDQNEDTVNPVDEALTELNSLPLADAHAKAAEHRQAFLDAKATASSPAELAALDDLKAVADAAVESVKNAISAQSIDIDAMPDLPDPVQELSADERAAEKAAEDAEIREGIADPEDLSDANQQEADQRLQEIAASAASNAALPKGGEASSEGGARAAAMKPFVAAAGVDANLSVDSDKNAFGLDELAQLMHSQQSSMMTGKATVAAVRFMPEANFKQSELTTSAENNEAVFDQLDGKASLTAQVASVNAAGPKVASIDSCHCSFGDRDDTIYDCLTAPSPIVDSLDLYGALSGCTLETLKCLDVPDEGGVGLWDYCTDQKAVDSNNPETWKKETTLSGGLAVNKHRLKAFYTALKWENNLEWCNPAIVEAGLRRLNRRLTKLVDTYALTQLDSYSVPFTYPVADAPPVVAISDAIKRAQSFYGKNSDCDVSWTLYAPECWSAVAELQLLGSCCAGTDMGSIREQLSAANVTRIVEIPNNCLPANAVPALPGLVLPAPEDADDCGSGLCFNTEAETGAPVAPVPLPDWPASLDFWLIPNGAAAWATGPTLNTGVIRDRSLALQNCAFQFTERHGELIFRGCTPGLKVTVPLDVNACFKSGAPCG